MQLIGAVGFKMVGTHGSSYEVHRVNRQQPQPTGAHHHYLTDKASQLAAAPIHTGKKFILWAWAHAFKRELAEKKSEITMKFSGRLSGTARTSRASLGAGDTASPVSPGDAGNGAAASGAVKAGSHTVVTISGSSDGSGTGSGAAAPDVTPLQRQQQQQQQQQLLLASLDSLEAAEADNEYTINPRLTLVFKEVWVSDRGVDRNGFGQWERLALQDELAELDEQLDAAAAAGAKFIIPGVSGRFAHSQLHAIMGPSGCGKTSLCKALARRLPSNRVLGDIRVLASSAADSYKSESALAVCGHTGRLAQAKCDLAHMTGYVPQFDLLHESLTVLENLEIACRLRLPYSAAHNAAADLCDAWAAKRRQRRLRRGQVSGVVLEVMALMALNKVAHQVVGCSGSRMISGGQRKRVAIGVELVAKPALLWLDEPTSGLDAAVAYDVVGALKSSSERGMNVLAVMHQPRCSIFNMFDTCLLLSSCGHVVFAGPQRMALAYAAFLGFYIPPGENVADFLMDVIAGVVPRPQDSDYIPSQLSTMWSKCGEVWVARQLREEQRALSDPGMLQHAATATGVPVHIPAPASTPVVDWPWRPRDLEALLSRFHLLVDAKRDIRKNNSFAEQLADADGDNINDKGSVLSYEGFLTFWDEAGVKSLLGEEQFAVFISGVCMLTCAAARLQRNALLRQTSTKQKQQQQPPAAAAAAAGRSVALPPAAANAPAMSSSEAMQQVAKYRQALSRFRAASKVVLAANASAASGMQQLKEARQLRTASQVCSQMALAGPCATLDEARALCLNQLADFLIMQHLQEEAERQDTSTHVVGRLQQVKESSTDHEAAAAAHSSSSSFARHNKNPLLLPDLHQDDEEADALHKAAPLDPAARKVACTNAAAAVRRRRPPSLAHQVKLIVLRSARKWVSSRAALMTDLLLTALLGIAVGVAQGRDNNPQLSLLWMLITQLAYGCMMLARSINSYGTERHLFLQQESMGGVSVIAWVFGHQIFDCLGLLLHPALFFAWLYVLTLSPVPAGAYYMALVAVGWYCSGVGYLVSMAVSPRNSLIAGLAAAMILGGVANGIAPRLWTLAKAHPLTWLNGISYTRWGLQAVYISWLTPTHNQRAPAVAAFLGGLGFCGLDPEMLQTLQSHDSTRLTAGNGLNFTTSNATAGQDWWRMSSVQRADAMAAAAADAYAAARASNSDGLPDAAAAAAMTQLWQYYNHPEYLHANCRPQQILAFALLGGLGLMCRLLLWLLVWFKVRRKASE
ncbi:hypothetical protein OEZ85_004499 [Tetradesmus obliquus]|nr:hypothetical protein OEZ85_004499 [Tetradesmus obliquus]